MGSVTIGEFILERATKVLVAYRLLRNKEPIKKTDQFLRNGRWSRMTKYHDGLPYDSSFYQPIRRAIELPSEGELLRGMEVVHAIGRLVYVHPTTKEEVPVDRSDVAVRWLRELLPEYMTGRA